MTTVFDSLNFRPGAGLPSAKDGAQLQRSLLSQLERQWLDDWAVADQLNAGAGAAAAKPPAESPTPPAEAEQDALVGIAAMSDRTLTTGPQHAPAATAAILAQHASAAAASFSAHTPATTPQHTPAAAGADLPRSLRQSVPGLSPAQAIEPQFHEGGAASDARAASTMSATTATSPDGQASSFGSGSGVGAPSAVKTAAATSGTAQPIASQSMLSAPAGHEDAHGVTASSAVVLSGADSAAAKQLQSTASESLRLAPATLEPASRVSTIAGLQDLSVGVGEASVGLAQANEETADQGLSAPARGGKALAVRPEETEPNPRFLRLREVSPSEAVASLRDAELDRSDSQRAAQGLARALMEAGYSRVQVVVNGVLEKQGDGERSAEAPENTTDMAARRAAIRSNTSSTEAQHGD